MTPYRKKIHPTNLNPKTYLSNLYVGGIRGKIHAINTVGAVHQQHGVLELYTKTTKGKLRFRVTPAILLTR